MGAMVLADDGLVVGGMTETDLIWSIVGGIIGLCVVVLVVRSFYGCAKFHQNILVGDYDSAKKNNKWRIICNLIILGFIIYGFYKGYQAYHLKMEAYKKYVNS
jgi:hypothetical protein